MRLLRDFRCDEGHTTERFIDSEIVAIDCPECGKKAQKILSFGTIVLDGTNPDFPGAYDKWARVREQRARINAKKDSGH